MIPNEITTKCAEDLVENRAAAIYYLSPNNEAKPFSSEPKYTKWENIGDKGKYRQIAMWHLAELDTLRRTFQSQQIKPAGIYELCTLVFQIFNSGHSSAEKFNELTKHLAPLLRDKKILDWLENNGRVARFSDGWSAWEKGGEDITKSTIREAALAAIQASKPDKDK